MLIMNAELCTSVLERPKVDRTKVFVNVFFTKMTSCITLKTHHTYIQLYHVSS